MYYDSNKESYHLSISSISVQGNEPYSVQQFLSSISILVSALVFIITNHSQMDSFVSFYSAHCSVSFAHHEHLSLIALVSIHLPINIHTDETHSSLQLEITFLTYSWLATSPETALIPITTQLLTSVTAILVHFHCQA